MSRPSHIKVIMICLISTSLSGCFAKKNPYGSLDGHPKKVPDIAKIANAKPKYEPRSKWGNPKSYQVFNKKYQVLKSSKGFQQKGTASWYGTKFHGRKTSNGETYDMFAMTAAHKSLPLPTYVEVRNLDNNKKVIVRVNDRGPFHGNRVIDLSYTAAAKLGIVGSGTGKVEIKAIDTSKMRWWHPKKAPASAELALNTPTTPPEELSGHYLQMGAFQERQNAEQLANRLKPHTALPVHITQTENLDTSLFKVRIGPLSEQDDPQKIQEQLKAANLPIAILISDIVQKS